MDNVISFPNTYSQESDLCGGYIALSDVWTTEASNASWFLDVIFIY